MWTTESLTVSPTCSAARGLRMDRDYCRHRLKGPRCVGIEVRPPFPFNLCVSHVLGCAWDRDNAHINHFPYVAVSARPAYPNPTYHLATTNLLDCFDISLTIVVSADSDAHLDCKGPLACQRPHRPLPLCCGECASRLSKHYLTPRDRQTLTPYIFTTVVSSELMRSIDRLCYCQCLEQQDLYYPLKFSKLVHS